MVGRRPNISYDQCEVDDMIKREAEGEFDGRDEHQCDHIRDYCKYLEMKNDVDGYNEAFCNKYQKPIDDINYSDCELTRQMRL